MTRRMILISTNHPYLRFSSQNILRALQVVHRREGKNLPPLAVICTTKKHIRKINREFLHHDSVTDVIAFPLGNDGGVEAEIYINLDAARTQAHTYGVTYTQEAIRLLLHGALHLLGYDDKTMREKKIMKTREETYLAVMRQKIGK
jgi:probable rRNA maturation factor